MENEPSAVDKFLEGTQAKENNPFEKVLESPFEQEVETKEEEEREEKPTPFHKDPKVIRFIEKEIEKRTQQQGPQREEDKTDEFKDVMDAMVQAIGNDTPQKQAALQAYRNALERLDQKGATQAQQYIENIQQREQEADREAEEELDEAFENIENNYGVDFSRNTKLRSEFASFVEKIAPKDRNGDIVDYPDMESAWETFSEIKSANRQPSRNKEIANRGMARSAETTATPTKRVTFDDFDEMIAGK